MKRTSMSTNDLVTLDKIVPTDIRRSVSTYALQNMSSYTDDNISINTGNGSINPGFNMDSSHMQDSNRIFSSQHSEDSSASVDSISGELNPRFEYWDDKAIAGIYIYIYIYIYIIYICIYIYIYIYICIYE
jgi:hypothetical protein